MLKILRLGSFCLQIDFDEPLGYHLFYYDMVKVRFDMNKIFALLAINFQNGSNRVKIQEVRTESATSLVGAPFFVDSNMITVVGRGILDSEKFPWPETIYG